MKRNLWRDICAVLCLGLGVVQSGNCASTIDVPESQGPPTVTDSIEMTTWANRSYEMNGEPDSPIALFSPDGQRFVTVLTKGDIQRNTLICSLLMFGSKQALKGAPTPRVLTTLSSVSGRDSIQRVRWVDNDRLVFLGENERNPAQVYQFTISSGQLKSLTNSPTSIVAFDISTNLGELVYEALPDKLSTEESKRRRGDAIVVSGQTPEDLLRRPEDPAPLAVDRELFVMSRGQKAVRVATPGVITEYLPLSLSPTGRYALVDVYLIDVPKAWQAYTDPSLHLAVTAQHRPGASSIEVSQLMLLDTKLHKMAPLIDAPMSNSLATFGFSPDERSVAVSGTYLPLEIKGLNVQDDSKEGLPVVEIELSGRVIHQISSQDMRVVSWKTIDNLSLKHVGGEDGTGIVTFQKAGEIWEKIPAKTESMNRWEPVVTLDEDMNTLPKLFVGDPNTGKKHLLLDLNPQLRNVAMSRVEAVHWTATDGHEVEGGLYYPVGYIEGKRYPLVIQTHGFRKDRFQMNGPYNSAYAARPMAARGIMVLQVGRDTQGMDSKFVSTPEEAPRQMAVFDGAIDELRSRGIIDAERVGLVGFSRTAFYVLYTLTHSTRTFAAAVLADGFDAGYMNYLLFPNNDTLAVNGGLPSDPDFKKSWLTSPGFNLDKIKTPVHLECYGDTGVLSCWQSFSGLSVLQKPVDFVWLPWGTHLLARPSDRLVSEQGTVDWFAFWMFGDLPLLNPKDPDQRKRWAGLRDARDRAAKAADVNVPKGQ